jgi:hypothetical protein
MISLSGRVTRPHERCDTPPRCRGRAVSEQCVNNARVRAAPARRAGSVSRRAGAVLIARAYAPQHNRGPQQRPCKGESLGEEESRRGEHGASACYERDPLAPYPCTCGVDEALYAGVFLGWITHGVLGRGSEGFYLGFKLGSILEGVEG